MVDFGVPGQKEWKVDKAVEGLARERVRYLACYIAISLRAL